MMSRGKDPEEPTLFGARAEDRTDSTLSLSGTDAADEPELRLPPAPQFTPGQIDDLGALLDLADATAGDLDAAIEAVRRRFFADKAKERKTEAEKINQQLRLARNTLTAMDNYGLYGLEEATLTEFGQELLALPDDEKRLDRLAQHILHNLHGTEVVAAAAEILKRGERVTKESLHRELTRAGFRLPRATTHHMSMGQWLRAAGVLAGGPHGWVVDDAIFEKLTGVRLATLDEWAGLTTPQQAYLKTLRRIAEERGDDPIPAKQVADLAEQEHGKIFKSDQLRRTLYNPLEKAGWIVMSATTPGRGGKGGTVTPLEKLLESDFERLTGYRAGGIPPDVRAMRNRPLGEVYLDLDSTDTYAKGLALEVLAVRLAMDLNLSPMRFRLRGTTTGGAELDLVAEGAHLHFHRWLFQCKNTRNVRLEDLAREIGMATLLRAHVVVMVTTGRFTRQVHGYADEIARNTGLQVVRIDSRLLAEYRQHGAPAVTTFFHDHARQTMRLKQHQVDEPIDELSGEA